MVKFKEAQGAEEAHTKYVTEVGVAELTPKTTVN